MGAVPRTGERVLQLRIIGRSGRVTESTREYIRRRVAYALARFESRIQSVTIRLDDLNGPKGGLDKHCRMMAKLQPSGHILAEVTDARVESAIARAADRLSRVLRTEIERLRRG